MFGNRQRLVVLGVLCAAAMPGCDLFTTGEAGVPVIDTINPLAGLPGVEVTLTGVDLRDPLTDPSAALIFDGMTIVAKSIDDIDTAAGVITFWGLDDQDGVEKIRFRTPVRTPANKIVDIQVVNKGGISKAAGFFDGNPPEAIADCLRETGDPDLCRPFNAFAGAVILEGTKEVSFYRFAKSNETTTDPTLNLDDWSDTVDVLTIPFGADGYDNIAYDVRLDSVGGGMLSLSQTPVTLGEDGLHGVLVLDGKYETPITSYETGLRPTRMTSKGMPLDESENRFIAVLSEHSARVDVFSGDIYGNREVYSLLGISNTARPKAAVFEGETLIYVAGTDPVAGAAWVALIDRETSTVTAITAIELGDVTPVDIIVDKVGQSTDIYVAFTANEDDVLTSGIFRYRESSNGDNETSTLSLPTGYAIRTLILDDRSYFGHPDPVSYPETTPQRVKQLWATLDDTSADNEDYVLGIRLTKNISFPAADSTYTSWRAHMLSLAAAEVSAYNAAASEAADLAGPEGATEAVAGITVPALPAVEIFGLSADSDSTFDGPYAITVVPNNVNIEKSPSFLLITNADGDNVTVVRTDGAGQGTGAGARLRADATTLRGYAWAAVDTGEDTQPGRLYCMQTSAD